MKALLPDRARALKACEDIGAEARGDIHQIDTYFRVPHGRLKLRIAQPGRSELVFYQRADAPGAKGCDYLLEPVSPSMGTLLADALGVLATVEKVRTLYIWKNVRIHLDQVVDLGDFIEFEAVQEDNTDDADGFEKLNYLADTFTISDGEQLKYAYLDMMLERT